MAIYYNVTKSSPTGDSIGVTRVRKDNAEYCVSRFAYQHLEAQGLLDSKFAHNLMSEIRTKFETLESDPVKKQNPLCDPTLPDNRKIFVFDCGFQRLITVSICKV